MKRAFLHAIGPIAVALLFLLASPNLSSSEAGKKSASREAANLYMGLLVDIEMYPKEIAVDRLAKGPGWHALDAKQMPPGPPKSTASQSAYFGKVGGFMFIVACDGTNDTFSIAMRDGFSSKEILEELRGSLTIGDLGVDDLTGQRSEMYRLSNQRNEIGLLMLTYGTVPSIAGTGTLAFMSQSFADRLGIAKPRSH